MSGISFYIKDLVPGVVAKWHGVVSVLLSLLYFAITLPPPLAQTEMLSAFAQTMPFESQFEYDRLLIKCCHVLASAGPDWVWLAGLYSDFLKFQVRDVNTLLHRTGLIGYEKSLLP